MQMHESTCYWINQVIFLGCPQIAEYVPAHISIKTKIVVLHSKRYFAKTCTWKKNPIANKSLSCWLLFTLLKMCVEKSKNYISLCQEPYLLNSHKTIVQLEPPVYRKSKKSKPFHHQSSPLQGVRTREINTTETVSQ